MRLCLTLAVLAALPLVASAQGAGKEPGPVKVIKMELKDLKKQPLTYEDHVDPIFAKHCTVCHSGNQPESKFDLSTYENLMKGGKRGEAVKPGKGDDSSIYKNASRTHKPFMPPRGNDPITPEELAIIKLWIDAGAKAPTTIRKRPEPDITIPPANVKPVRALAVSPDKTTVAAGRGNQIHIYDAGSGKHIRSLISPNLKTKKGLDVKAAHISLVESMAWSPDGKYLVSGSFQELTIWDAMTGEQRHKITGFKFIVVAIAFSQDGKMFGVAGGEPTVDGEVKIFEVGTWKLIMDLKNCHSDTVYGIAFSPEKMKLPIEGQKDKFQEVQMIATCSADKFVKTWTIPDGKMVKSFEGHTHHVLDVGWASDGKLLASAGADNTVKIWDFDKGEQARTINAHGKQVTRLLFVGKKNEFLTAGGDNIVKRFNAANGGNTGSFTGGTDFIYAVACSSDGAVVVSGGQEGVVRVYNGTNAAFQRNLMPPDAQPPMKEVKKE
jgi:WD40 repeat protein